jgi:hypothetical protein
MLDVVNDRCQASGVITSLPNTNIADAVGRLPSVTLERDEGEGKYVQIRGTEPRLSNVTINGVHVPSPEAGVRNIKLDAVPSDIVERIEVNKTLSPNQDGDAIGGSVNLVTKTPTEKPTYSFGAQGGYTPIQDGRWLSGFNGTLGQRFGCHKIGLKTEADMAILKRTAPVSAQPPAMPVILVTRSLSRRLGSRRPAKRAIWGSITLSGRCIRDRSTAFASC